MQNVYQSCKGDLLIYLIMTLFNKTNNLFENDFI